MPHRDFDAARRERLRQVEALTFELGGEVFHCRTTFGLADVWNDPPEAPKNIAEAATHPIARTFLSVARDICLFLIPDDVERWWDLFDPAATEIIQGQDLLDILNWLSGDFTGRPTSPSDVSSNGPAGGTTGSTSSSEPAETD